MSSSQAKPFLLEIGFEELPHENLEPLVQFMVREMDKILYLYQWGHKLEEIRWIVTPRRIGIVTPSILEGYRPRREVKYGPIISRAIQDGCWHASALGFFKKFGYAASVAPCDLSEIASEDLQNILQKNADRPDFVFASKRQDGVMCIACVPELPLISIKDIYQDFLQKILAQKDFAKMRWPGTQQEFIRPVRWVVALHGEEKILLSFCGIESDRKTYPHRLYFAQKTPLNSGEKFGGNRPIELTAVDKYEKSLLDHGVYPSIFSFTKNLYEEIEINKRLKPNVGLDNALTRQDILQDVLQKYVEESSKKKLDPPSDLRMVPNPFEQKSEYLWSEIETLTEGFSPFFFESVWDFSDELPKELLESELYVRQRMIPVFKKRYGASPCGAIVIGDIPYGSQIHPRVQEGYKKVLSARVKEAHDLYQEDLQKGTSAMMKELCSLVYQEKLGTYQDRFKRIDKMLLSLEKFLISFFCTYLVIPDEVPPMKSINPYAPTASIHKKENLSKTVLECLKLRYVDAVSKVVFEFPHLRGQMSQYYVFPRLWREEMPQYYIEEHPRYLILMHAIGFVDVLADERYRVAGQFLKYFAQYWDKVENILSHYAAGLAPTPYSDPHRVKQEANQLIETCFSFWDYLQEPLDFEEDWFIMIIDWSDPKSFAFNIPLGHFAERPTLPVDFLTYKKAWDFLLQRLRYQVGKKSDFLPKSFLEGENLVACCDAVRTTDHEPHWYLQYFSYPMNIPREISKVALKYELYGGDYLNIIFRMCELSKLLKDRQHESTIKELVDQIKRVKNITRDFSKDEQKRIINLIPPYKRYSEIISNLKGFLKSENSLILNLFSLAIHFGNDFFSCYRRDWGGVLFTYIRGDACCAEEGYLQKGYILLMQEVFENVKINDEDPQIRTENLAAILAATKVLTGIANWEELASRIGEK